MLKAPIPMNEESRLAAVAAYRELDEDATEVYEDFIKIASYIADVPVALITLVDKETQFFLAKVGMEEKETSRDSSFCAHAILDPYNALKVEDASKDLRFADNPLVTDGLGIKFYCGVPLVTSDDQALGTLCVIDKRPRILSKEQEEALKALARRVMNRLEIHKLFHDLEKTIHSPDKHETVSSKVDDLTHQLGNLLLKRSGGPVEFK